MKTLDLWTLRLAAAPGDESLLDERERSRLDRLRVDDKRAQFLAAQSGLRRVLASYLGVGAGEVEFAYGPHGKPSLPAAPEFGFNLSHSATLAIVGVARGADIGVDLEWNGRDRPFLRLARRYFDPEEHDWLEGRPEEAVRAGFYRTWTLKEAFLKALGTGLTVPPSSFRIDLEAEPPRLLSTPDDGAPEIWSFLTPAVADDYSAAICWKGAGRQLVRRRFE